MKNFKLFLSTNLVILAILFSNNLRGASVTFLEIRPLETEKSFLLIVEGKGSGNIQVKILDADKKLFFSKGIKSGKTFVKKFNLETLERGNYYLHIEDELKLTVQPLIINATGLEINKKQRKYSYKPIVKYDKETGFINVSWFMDRRADYKLIIGNKSMETVFKDKVEDSLIVQRYYDATDLLPGVYYLTFSNGTQSHVRTIKVN